MRNTKNRGKEVDVMKYFIAATTRYYGTVPTGVTGSHEGRARIACARANDVHRTYYDKALAYDGVYQLDLPTLYIGGAPSKAGRISGRAVVIGSGYDTLT